MQDKVKVIVLDGNLVSETYISKELVTALKDIYKILDIDEYSTDRFLTKAASFGDRYTMFWQVKRVEETSMELTVYSGVPSPVFIDSKVIIVYEDTSKNTSGLSDIKQEEVRKYFNTKNKFWALVKGNVEVW